MNELMRSAPDQYESERLLDDALSHGDKSKLANVLEVSLSEISQQCNPNESRKSDYYRCKRFLWGLAGVNAEAARILRNDLNTSIDLWIGDIRERRDPAELASEVAEKAIKHMKIQLQSLPKHVQLQSALSCLTSVNTLVENLKRESGEFTVIRSQSA